MPFTFQSHGQLHQPEHWSDDWWNQQDHDNQSFNINTLRHPTVPVAQKENDQIVAELPKIDEERKKTMTGECNIDKEKKTKQKKPLGTGKIEMLSPEDMKAAVLKDPGDEKKSGVSEEDKAASDIFKTKYTTHGKHCGRNTRLFLMIIVVFISKPKSSSDDEEKKQKKKKKTKRNCLSDDDKEEFTCDKFLADAVGVIQDKNKVAREMEYKNYELASKRDK
ncbi:hypothetical protein F5876DRAFT_70978 [Lentinula aff. lateritia]|uniref:Uncharacterized protein n=1 Tax=Lentinula aff. lateritia TaxID=2804960 RepID=A0ACC1TH25_9AGAR|nr:hypothetical protein F5876DRAFT_70978 [Lentinula aff. lateritia]